MTGTEVLILLAGMAVGALSAVGAGFLTLVLSKRDRKAVFQRQPPAALFKTLLL